MAGAQEDHGEGALKTELKTTNRNQEPGLESNKTNRDWEQQSKTRSKITEMTRGTREEGSREKNLHTEGEIEVTEEPEQLSEVSSGEAGGKTRQRKRGDEKREGELTGRLREMKRRIRETTDKRRRK